MSPHTILVVDDNETDQLANRRALSGAGDVIMGAGTIASGLAMVAERKPELVVLDYNLPDGTGLEFMQRIQEMDPQDAPSVVMVTGSGDEEVAVSAIKAGACDYLIKDVEGGYLKLLPAVVERAWRERAAKLDRAESERQLQLAATVFKSVTEGIVITTPDGTIVSANPAICAMTGYALHELLGANPRLIKSGSHGPEVYRAMWRTLRQDGRWQGELWNRRKDGSLFLTHETITVVYDEAHQHPLNYVGVLVDVTEVRQAEAELTMHRDHLEDLVKQRTSELLQTEERASLILQSSANGLYGVDTHGLITFMNPVGCAMLGYRAEDLIGQPCHALFHHSKPDGSPYPPDQCPTNATLKDGKEVHVDDEVYWHADGHPIPVLYATHPMVQNNEIKGAVVSFVDISDQRATAQAREDALLAAENLARVRREFLANMSHEIRTPLNGILGFAQIGCMNHHNSEKARYAFEMIQESGHQLLRVINDVLDFSKIEAGKLSIELSKVVLPDVVDHAIGLVKEQALSKHLDLRVVLKPDLPRYCISDPSRMGQVLHNLLSNAVKFTEAGQVTLTVSIQGTELVFEVADTGIGMTEEQINAVFNPFHQGDTSATRRFGGTGLGLTIAKGVLNLMQGSIRVRSKPGVGSSFEVRLPYVPVQADMPYETVGGELSTDDMPLAGISVLVAEDSAINREVLEGLLHSAGAQVMAVSNGREAVDRVLRDGRHAYDVVLMDIQMPVMDGYEATTRLISLAPDLPIIGQTAHAFAEERQRCLAVGMVEHLAKPIDRNTLVHAIKKSLGQN